MSAYADKKAMADISLHHYQAHVSRVIDGDTIVADLDLGCHTWKHDQRLRLLGFDAPERGQANFQHCTDRLEQLLQSADYNVVVHTVESDSFGRWLAEVYVFDDEGEAISVNEMMVFAVSEVVEEVSPD